MPTGESDTTYVALKAVAQARLDNVDPGLDTTLYDWCHALLITHMALADDTTGFKSYSTAEFSASQDPGTSIFLLEMNQILETFSESVDYSSETDTTRCDADMPEFHLDQADVPTYYLEV
ncbi:MAG: hypothetical protein M0Q91_09950 [Methanoregula sp.]|nr:hypothetical protein [Methanoregula sp.]